MECKTPNEMSSLCMYIYIYIYLGAYVNILNILCGLYQTALTESTGMGQAQVVA